MARSLALLALSSAVMAAQTTTVSLLLPFADPQPLVGSVIAVDSTATTYAYGCAPGTPSDDCGFDSSQTITQGPTTWIFTNTYVGDDQITYTQSGDCNLNSASDVASCNVFMQAVDTVSSSFIASASGGTEPFLSSQLPVTITAGVDKLKASPGASPTDGPSTTPTSTGASETSQTVSSGAGSTTVAKQTTASSTGTRTGTRTASTTAAPSSTNAAGIANAQNGLLAGVAAVVGGVMML